jgi:hypothetical protein
VEWSKPRAAAKTVVKTTVKAMVKAEAHGSDDEESFVEEVATTRCA